MHRRDADPANLREHSMIILGVILGLAGYLLPVPGIIPR